MGSGGTEAGIDNETIVSKAQARDYIPRARPPHTRRLSPGGARPRDWKPENLQAPEGGPGHKWGGAALGSPGSGRRDYGKVDWGRGRAEPNNQGSDQGISPRARAGAGREGRPGLYLLLDLPVLRDDPVSGGEGPSSCHTQQGGKAEEPAWARTRRQLTPAADPYCSRHLAPPARPLTPEAEVGPRRPPS